jgi:hypothetical protein
MDRERCDRGTGLPRLCNLEGIVYEKTKRLYWHLVRRAKLKEVRRCEKRIDITDDTILPIQPVLYTRTWHHSRIQSPAQRHPELVPETGLNIRVI